MDDTIDLEISANDTMYEGSREHYLSVGQSALQCVRAAMNAADKSSVQNILDFGCGFGRVLRTLKAAFPAAELTACDISREAVEFCARTFEATPVLSRENPAAAPLEDKFDLVWCGTVLTQFDAAQFLACVEFLHSLLSPGGLFVFTTHGPFVARQLRAGAANYGLDEKSVSTLLDGYEATGFGYANYPMEVLPLVGMTKYGVCVSKPSWICRQIESNPNMRLITYTERAWDNHQDSIACTNQ